MSWKMMTAIVGQLAHDTVPENFLKIFYKCFFFRLLLLPYAKPIVGPYSRPLSSTRPPQKKVWQENNQGTRNRLAPLELRF